MQNIIFHTNVCYLCHHEEYIVTSHNLFCLHSPQKFAKSSSKVYLIRKLTAKLWAEFKTKRIFYSAACYSAKGRRQTCGRSLQSRRQTHYPENRLFVRRNCIRATTCEWKSTTKNNCSQYYKPDCHNKRLIIPTKIEIYPKPILYFDFIISNIKTIIFRL